MVTSPHSRNNVILTIVIPATYIVSQTITHTFEGPRCPSQPPLTFLRMGYYSEFLCYFSFA